MMLADLPVAAAAAAGLAYKGAVFAVVAAVALAAIAAAAARHQVVAAGHRDQAVPEMQQSSLVAVESSCQQALVVPAGSPAETGTAAVPGVAAVNHSSAGGQGAGPGAACRVAPGHFAMLLLRAVRSSA